MIFTGRRRGSCAGRIEMDGPPQLLQIVREPLKVGEEAAYAAIENETARACAELKCPHPHLALEPLGGPKEVWWLNSFASERDRQRVTEDYLRNGPLMAVLDRNSKRKARVTGTPVNLVLNYRPDLSRAVRWELAGARFVVMTGTTGKAPPDGPVFEAPDGTRLVLCPAKTRDEAERLASSHGKDNRVSGAPVLGDARERLARRRSGFLGSQSDDATVTYCFTADTTISSVLAVESPTTAGLPAFQLSRDPS